jgi:hypothetical protein
MLKDIAGRSRTQIGLPARSVHRDPPPLMRRSTKHGDGLRSDERAASRLAAMQRADKNINDLLEQLQGTFHQLRQSGIDEELFDVISGFEASSG